MTNTLEPTAEPRDLTESVPQRMRDAVLGLASLKLALDALSRDAHHGMGQALLDDWMEHATGGTCAYTGHEFLFQVLPFMLWEADRGDPQYHASWVDPSHVLGACIQGRPEHIPPGKVAQRIEDYLSFKQSFPAQYWWLKPLGIFVAHEGKHRVAFMRAHGQPALAAMVRELQYPVPERLTLIEPVDGRDDWLVLLDGQHLQVLRHPRVTRELLSAYGVETKRWRQLRELPAERTARDAIYDERLHRPNVIHTEAARTLNLQPLKERENAGRPLDPDARARHALLSFAISVGCIAPGLVVLWSDERPMQQWGWLLVLVGAVVTPLRALRVRGSKGQKGS